MTKWWLIIEREPTTMDMAVMVAANAGIEDGEDSRAVDESILAGTGQAKSVPRTEPAMAGTTAAQQALVNRLRAARGAWAATRQCTRADPPQPEIFTCAH